MAFVGLVVGLIKHLLHFEAVILGLRTSYQVLVKCCSFVASVMSFLSLIESYNLVLDLRDFCAISSIESGAVLMGETMSHFDGCGVSSVTVVEYSGTCYGMT